MLSARALDSQVYERRKQKRTDEKELARMNGELRNKLKATEETIAGLKGDVRGSSRKTKRVIAERESISGSGGSQSSVGSPKVRSPTY